MDRAVLRKKFVELVQEIAVVVVNLVAISFESGSRRTPFFGVGLEAGGVSGNGRLQLGAAVAVITSRVLGVGFELVQVGRRQVHGHLDTLSLGRVGHLAHQVTLATTPGAGRR